MNRKRFTASDIKERHDYRFWVATDEAIIEPVPA
jgi:hypothetical protein